MSTWTTEDPGIGSPAEIRGYASSRSATAATLRSEASGRLSTALTDTAGWASDVATVVVGVVTRIQPEPSLIADQLDAEARALNAYAAEIERIQARVRSIRNRREHLGTQLWMAELGLTRTVRQDNVTGTEAADQSRAQRRIELLTDQVNDLDRELQSLATERQHADAACTTALTGTTVLGTLAAFTSGGTSSSALLARLAQLSATELLILAHTQPALFEQLHTAPPTPTEVADWWAKLDPSAQAALIAAAPAVIGNLSGVAYGARDQANRIYLETQLEQARKEYARLSDQPRTSRMPPPGLSDAETRLQALKNIQATLLVGAPGDRFLVALTGDVPPLAQVAIGNLDTAENVSYLIPGMGTYTTDMAGWTRAAQNIFNEQRFLDTSQSYAVVAWIGYKTPPIPGADGLDFGVFRGEYARAGADKLAADLAGFNAATAGSTSTLNVVAHSYGTTTSATALAEHDLEVRNYVMLGSAGIEPAIGGAAGVHAEHVYAAQAPEPALWAPSDSGDRWAWNGRRYSGRDNPVDAEFGAIVFGADGEPGHADLKPTTEHDSIAGGDDDESYGYLEKKTESLRNTARVLIGQREKVTPDQTLMKEAQ